jgi:putative DNA primase/helicase
MSDLARGVQAAGGVALAEAAAWYGAHDIPVFPLIPRDKKPLKGSHGFKDATTDPKRIADWWEETPDANIGMPTGAASGRLAVDVDPRNGGPADRDEFIRQFGQIPDTAEQITGRGDGGRHILFRWHGGKLPDALAPGVDLKVDGGYIVVAPSIHPDTGTAYQWDGIEGVKALLHPADPPAWFMERIAGRNGHGAGRAAKIPEVIRDGEKHATCVSLAGSMRHRGCNADEIYAALLKLSERFETPVPAENLKRIAESVEGLYPPAATVSSGSAPDLLAFLFNDHGNAERLIALHGEDLRYCHSFKKWLTWDGRRWAVDVTDQSRRLVKGTMLEFLRQGIETRNEPAEKFARQSLDAKRISSTLSMAECEIFVTPDQLDQYPYLLNFPNGTVDLRGGELAPHEREHYITKLVHFDFIPGAPCPLFQRFLARILTPALIQWLQKAMGYSLTGLTSEKAVFLCHGIGNNGKTTLLSLLMRLLEEYSVLLQIDSLMVRMESNNTQADLADLRGARFVMTSETEEGQRLAEGKLKRNTQGMGKIKAVRKYENPIQFSETHKLWIDANHLPLVRGTDNAIWNRLRPIPFEVVLSSEEIDRDLPGKLAAEAEGILAWAVAGAVRWYCEGLGTPAEVETANRSWRADMDQLGRFIEDSCITGEYARAKARTLYLAYKTWAEGAGEHPVTEVVFTARLVEHEFSKEHTRNGAVYHGIGLRVEGDL